MAIPVYPVSVCVCVCTFIEYALGDTVCVQTCVVDEHVELAFCLFDMLFGSRDRSGVSDVKNHRLYGEALVFQLGSKGAG